MAKVAPWQGAADAVKDGPFIVTWIIDIPGDWRSEVRGFATREAAVAAASLGFTAGIRFVVVEERVGRQRKIVGSRYPQQAFAPGRYPSRAWREGAEMSNAMVAAGAV